jgi:hypothetical protein
MRFRLFSFSAVVWFALLIPALSAQTEPVAKLIGVKEIFGGYAYLSNSFNSHTGFRGPGLNGWDAAAAFPIARNLGVKVEGLGFYGNSLGYAQDAHFFLAGGQYTQRFSNESVFVHGLAGIGHINTEALTLGGEGPSSNFALAADGGGGLDTPISKRMAWRVEGALLYANFTPASNQIHSTPNYFARISTGIVWRF